MNAALGNLSEGLGVVILTGGASLRMGSDKALADWAGLRAVDRVARLSEDLGAAACITVGRIDYGLTFVADKTPLGGPVGGVLVGAERLREAGIRRALVLAVDAPTVRPDDVRPLLEAVDPAVAYEGLNLPFVARLSAVPDVASHSWPLARLLEVAGVRRLPVADDAHRRLRGANTVAERDILLHELRATLGASRDGGPL